MFHISTYAILVVSFIYVDPQTSMENITMSIFGTPPPCQCVAYYLCKNSKTNTDRKHTVDLRSKALDSVRCSNYLDECCSPSQITNILIKPPLPLRRFGCGQHYPNGKAFQTIGNLKNESNYAEFPWMTIVYEELSFGSKRKSIFVSKCGGALINIKVVITAAHCVSKNKKLKVKVGEWDKNNKKEIYPTQDRDVGSVIIHPDFYEPALTNDIALLFLTTPVDIAENVDVVCLPSTGAIFNNANCFATGWGKTSFGGPQYAHILKKTSLSVVDRYSCQNILRSSLLGFYFILDQSFICAGGKPEEDTCEGDGGGPLVCPVYGKQDTYQLAGIISWGIECKKPYPAAYVNVAMFREWIDQTMVANGLNTLSYTVV